MPDPQAATFTFLFTDIEGSTRSAGDPQAMQAALARHDALLQQALTAHGGHIFKTVGDAFYAAFATAPAALEAAVAAQQALAVEPWPLPEPLRVRMALHIGAAEARDGDYFGPPLNRVARLLTAGHGGQVLLSLPIAELVRDHLPAGVELHDLGRHRLRDLLRPEQIFQLGAPGLPTEFPLLRTLDSRANNLPAQPTAFIGRAGALATLRTLLGRPDVRLLTLTGPGGIGKTRLSLQLAADVLDDFAQGVCFVPLAAISDPSLVISALVQALGLRAGDDQPVDEALLSYLTDKQMLLVLDNFEQVVAAAPLISALLGRAPRLKALVTSRAVLHLSGEQEFAVPPLTLPDPRRLPALDVLAHYEAVALFIQCAQRVKPDFVVTHETAPAVAEICVRLDGLPLALELAAARTRLLSPPALLTRLDHRLQVLIGGPRDLPARQQTLREAIAWSYDLLEAAEKLLFARLAVFVGGAALTAVEAVCGDAEDQGSPLMGHDVLAVLEALVGKSLVQQEESDPPGGRLGDSRVTLLATIGEYAREQLQASGEAKTLQRRHASYYLALAAAGEVQLEGCDQGVWLARLETEYPNLRAALHWWAAQGHVEQALEMAGALHFFWYTRGYFEEASAELTALLARPEAAARTRARAKACYALGQMGAGAHGAGAARAWYEESLTIAQEVGDRRCEGRALLQLVTKRDHTASARRQVAEESVALLRNDGDVWGTAWALDNLARIDREQGRGDVARTRLEDSLRLRRSIGDRYGMAYSYELLAEIARAQADPQAAGALLAESLALNRAVGDKTNTARVLARLGDIACDGGDYPTAHARYAECMMIMRARGMRSGMVTGLLFFVKLALVRAQLVRAVRLYSATVTLGATFSYLLNPAEHAAVTHRVMLACQQLPGESATTARAEGQAMTLEQAISYALQETGAV